MKPYKDWLAGVGFSSDLDGGGRILAPIFADVLMGRKFKRCFEWCAGPAWIGLWLLESGIIEELVTGDINPKAVAAVKATAAANGYNVTAYKSDNLKEIPEHEFFDLVVANPPNYCDIQSSHPFGHLRHDLRPSDIGWQIHREFYATIGAHLNAGAELWISEVEPFGEKVLFQGEVYDRRPRPPIVDFLDMMATGDLMLEKITLFEIEATRLGLLKVRST